MRDLERILKATANRRRLAILKYLKENKEASVGEITKQVKISFKAASKHLGILLAADIVDREHKAFKVFYSLSSTMKKVVKGIISHL